MMETTAHRVEGGAPVRVLVAYATKHGATEGIADRVGRRLRARGHDVEVRAAGDAGDPGGYDAFVVGSATYVGHWRKEALALVDRLRPVVGDRPVWLFSSGPLGDNETDAKGQDVKQSAEPRDLAELTAALHPRDHRVFFGALDPSTLTLPERAMRTLPAGRELLPEGDFRDWEDIDAWVDAIADELPA